jgi:hypothetical protein
MSSLMIPKMFAAELFGGVVAPARTLSTDRLAQCRNAVANREKVRSTKFLCGWECGVNFGAILRKQYDDYGPIIRDASLTRE